MIISDSKKFLFIAVPKTGTTFMHNTILKKLSNKEKDSTFSGPIFSKIFGCQLVKNNNHAKFSDLSNTSRFKDYFKFCFVRNPFDRVVSWFTYLTSRQGRHIDLEEIFSFYGSQWDTPEDFDNFCAEAPDFVFNNQLLFCINKRGLIAMDFIGKFEDFEQDFTFAYKNIYKEENPNINFKKINPSNRSSYQSYYTSFSKNIIEEKCAIDLKFFDYKF